MNKIIKLVLFSLIIFFSITFYKIYFKEKTIAEKDFEIIPNVEEKEYENNLIKDLKYSINLGQNNKYIINSKLSEITYKDDKSEVVNMQGVTAVIIDGNQIPIEISSDIAKYNNSNYETLFEKNVKIKYLNHEIFSNAMQFDFENQLIRIYKDVEYNGALGKMFADNIDINLVMNKIDIYMNGDKKNVKLMSN
jgi:lipopolysaccharide export system protein LptC